MRAANNTTTTKGKTIMATKKVAQPEQQHHYFASTAFGWQVAQTRAEAVAGVARSAGRDIIKANTKAHGGLYCWSCRVELPQSAHYDINNYAPQGVPKSAAKELRIIDIKGNVAVEDAA